MKYLKITSELFQNHFSRRITGLLLLSALVPLITTAYLSKNYISNMLIEQGYLQLQQESKYFSIALYDRLLLTESRLKYIANIIKKKSDIATNKEKYLGKEFTSLSIKEISLSEFYSKLDTNKSYITSDTTQSGTTIHLTYPFLLNEKQAIMLTAELSQENLWNKENNTLSHLNNCILNSAGIKLHCTDLIPDNIEENNTDNFDGKRKIYHWKKDNIDYISSSRILFLKSRFNSESWRLITTQAKKSIFLPAENFNKLFILVVALTLLVVILLSIIQIRRSLTPLEKLIRGTQSLAENDFNQRIDIKSNNEFYKLAQSFNVMSDRLKKQFSAFTVLSIIDQLILSNPESENIYLTIFEYIHNISPCEAISITILNQDAPNIGNSFLYKPNSSEKYITDRIRISETDFEKLENSIGKHSLIKVKEQSFLTPIKKLNIDNVYIFPISVDNNLSAFITSGYKESPNLNDDDIYQITAISERLAVALSAAARDKKLYQQSYYDNLTGLPNRQLLNSRLKQEITKCHRFDSSLAVLFLDLDRFKKINDTLGHTIGDELLIKISQRLLKCVRETDTVARLGGDEFTVILSGPVETIDIAHIADKIISEINKPFYINSNEIFTSTSIGISVFPNDGTSRTELLKNADTAMYQVKESGRGKHLFFEEQMNIEEMERVSLENDMRKALAQNKFILHYQPIINLKSGIITGAEALIRWYHPVRGLVPTEKFICLAEETGLMEKIGEWVLYTACTHFKEWQAQGCIIDRVAVNVSSRQFMQNNFVEMVDAILNETNMSADNLELEITESLLMDDHIDSNEILQKLSKKNINLSIDDFGTGFSSLSYLKRFPVDTLKIDQSFMKDVPDDKDSCTIVKSIITLGHTLNLKVIAEGIESPQQLKILYKNNCDYAQGFYFSRALSANDFTKFVQKHNNATIQTSTIID
jgi:diguanylate cyclase (GGDEF)-like protein